MAKRFRQTRKLASKIFRRLGRGNKLQPEPITVLERPNDNDANNNYPQLDLEEIPDLQSTNQEQTRGQFQIVNGFDIEEGPEIYYELDQFQDEEPLEYNYEMSTPELISEDSDKESLEIIEEVKQNNDLGGWGIIPQELETENWGFTPKEETNNGDPWVEEKDPDQANWCPWSGDSIPENTTQIEKTTEIQQSTTTFIPITFLKYKGQPLPCGCDKRKLQDATHEHMSRIHCTRKKNFHCCKCSRPLAKDEVYEGTNEYYQLCRSCDRIEKYDITTELWYHTPCQVCGQPIEQKENITGTITVVPQSVNTLI
jgi:predicted nucleic acid-binding Zn ribbon protein